ncbi:MAG: hypothetical protein RML40_01060 [Bacteroidota bacterium]|nr:hypothetical protein [Candidatus Kapabacteria bacterium]MDW8219097.1 hypothetical protein [Bacteroidota bacterium]
MLRTQQVGGIFTLERFVFPGIVSSLTLPQNASTEHHTLALIGGFEANYLTARDIQCDFHRRNGLYNDDIGLAFGHRIMYPLYAFVFAPQDPNSPQTWRAAGGDPINFTKLVWELGNRPVFNPDSSINQDLVHFYNQTVLVSILWNMLDGNFYKEILAFFGNQVQGQQPISWRTDSFQWSYGTVFNTSPLGAELYLHNYFTVHQAFYSIYLKYGFPLKNYGIGITATDVLHFDRGGLDVQADAWNQDLYGMGFCLSSFAHYTIFGTVDLHLQAGYKTQGYVLGRPIQNGLIGYVGMRYRF